MGMLPPEFVAAWEPYERTLEKVKAEQRERERRLAVLNKISMQCATLGCQSAGPLTPNEGRPRGWFSVDVEGPFEGGRVSLVLCPGCAVASVGDLIPKPVAAPKTGVAP